MRGGSFPSASSLFSGQIKRFGRFPAAASGGTSQQAGGAGGDRAGLEVFHVAATSRFKSFSMPARELGYDESIRFQEAECAKMKNVLDAFRAPSAGDAQWLAKIEQEYRSTSTVAPKFKFTCDDFSDKTCAQAAKALIGLQLRSAASVVETDCPDAGRGDQVNNCYRLTFPYAGTDDTEWIMSVVGGMSNGMAPVEIRSLHLEHVRKPLILY
jgi:hypothetical protein